MRDKVLCKEQTIYPRNIPFISPSPHLAKSKIFSPFLFLIFAFICLFIMHYRKCLMHIIRVVILFISQQDYDCSSFSKQMGMLHVPFDLKMLLCFAVLLVVGSHGSFIALVECSRNICYLHYLITKYSHSKIYHFVSHFYMIIQHSCTLSLY